MKHEWIVVASRDEARIFGRRGIGPLELVCDMGNIAGRLRPRDLESDKPGRSTDNRMHARHALSTEESKKERILRDFYREVVDRLERGLYDHQYDSLTIIAESRLLGIVRGLLPEKVKRAITREISKDLSYEEESQIMKRLEEAR
jgi:protein required for attachment to host cells